MSQRHGMRAYGPLCGRPVPCDTPIVFISINVIIDPSVGIGKYTRRSHYMV
jgi:hypothetical protein